MRCNEAHLLYLAVIPRLSNCTKSKAQKIIAFPFRGKNSPDINVLFIFQIFDPEQAVANRIARDLGDVAVANGYGEGDWLQSCSVTGGAWFVDHETF